MSYETIYEHGRDVVTLAVVNAGQTQTLARVRHATHAAISDIVRTIANEVRDLPEVNAEMVLFLLGERP